VGDTTSLVPGFPIRTSSDPRSVDNSPRHIAASHVLHRPLMPRHPPCALKHLQHKKHSTKKQQKTPTHMQGPHSNFFARCSQPLSNTQTPHPTTKARRQPDPPPPVSHTGRRDSRPVVSKPNSVSGNSLSTRAFPTPISICCCTRTGPTTDQRPIQRIAAITEPPHNVGGPQSRGAP
jgi:hypothetical protein